MPPTPLGDGALATPSTQLCALCSRRRQRTIAGNRSEKSSRKPVSRAEDHLTPLPAQPGEPWENTRRLCRQREEPGNGHVATPNRGCTPPWKLPVTAPHKLLFWGDTTGGGDCPSQSCVATERFAAVQPRKRGPTQRAEMPPEATQDLRAEPVSTDVRRVKREGRRPSARPQWRQGCAEFRLYCRRWDPLWVGLAGLLTVLVAAMLGLLAGGKIASPTAIHQKLVWDTHQPALAGAPGVPAKSQLWWYRPYLDSEIRRRVRQCETCQAGKHGRPPDTAGR